MQTAWEDHYDRVCDERSYGPNHCATCGNDCDHDVERCEDCEEIAAPQDPTPLEL